MPKSSPAPGGAVTLAPRSAPRPEDGPRLLFFSGGTALRGLSRELVKRTHNSIHLITPFDSGGSSAALRRALAMPAVGDLRNRLLALAERGEGGCPGMLALLSRRLPADAPAGTLWTMLDALAKGSDAMLAATPEPGRGTVTRLLGVFRDLVPADFDPRGASIGNLVLAGGYLESGRDIEPAIAVFSELVKARGEVGLTLDADLTVNARLADGSAVCGQHRLTGKQVPPIASPVERINLSQNPDGTGEVRPTVPPATRERIARAQLICFPMGSFYSSLLVHFLVDGVGAAVAANPCPKVYVPNAGTDPEQSGRSLPDLVGALIAAMRDSGARDAAPGRLLDTVLVDAANESGATGGEDAVIRALGVGVVRARLTTPDGAARLDDRLLLEQLLSLV